MNNSDGTPEISTTGSGKRRWILATLCLSVLLVSMDNMIVNVALPDIGRSMDAPTSTLQWVVDGYVVSFAGLLLTAGHLGDHFGRRRVMQIGLVVFALASVLASTGSTARTLIAARALMGAGAALVYPSTLAILTAEFTDPHRRAAAIGVWSGVSGMGLALGPVLGGLLMRRFAWDSVFTVNIPIAVIALVAGRIVLPESRGCVRSPLDVVGAALSLVSIALLVATIIEAPDRGWRSASTLAWGGVAVVLLIALALHLRRAAHPLVDPRLFSDRRFTVAACALAIASFALFGFTFLITMYLQLVKGYDPLTAGVATLPYAVVMGVVSPLSPALARRWGTRWVIGGGMALMAAGLWVATLAEPQTSYLGLVVPSMVLMAGGMALATSPATSAVMAAVPSDQAGAGSAINDTARQLGGALGTAVMGSVLSSQFASRVTTGWTPWRLPDAAMAIARGSLGAAQAVAGRCPEPIRGPLIRAANLAYVDAMHLATWTGIGAALLSAVVALVLFPSHQHRKTARPDGPGSGTPAGARRDLRRPARTTGAS